MKKVVFIIGRNDSLNFKLDKKLEISYLDFFCNISEIKEETIDLNLSSFFDAEIKTNENAIYELNKTDSQSVYFVEAFYDQGRKLIVLSCILHSLKKQDLIDYEHDKIFYLCHDTHFGKPMMTEQRIANEEKAEIIGKLEDLLNTTFLADNVLLATFYHENTSKIFSALKTANINRWKDFDVDSLLNKFDKDLLEEQKKKLIDIFLPLAIDMQGLTEVTDEKKRGKYLEEVLFEISKNANDISTKWNEIKTVLALKVSSTDEPKVVLSEFYRFNNDEKKMLYFPLESEVNPGISKEKLLKYLKTPEVWNEEEFLPNWLRQVVGKIDEKISKAPNDNPDSH